MQHYVGFSQIGSHMALFKYFKQEEKRTISNSSSLLSRNDVEEANKAVAKALGSTSKALRVKYNSYTSAQRAKIGKYAVEHGATNATKHFTSNGALA